VLRQTYRDFELIVVDDGSIDNTKEVIASINDSRIRYIYQENRGPSAAFNTGILASEAEYVSFLASDNIMLEETLQKCIAFMDQHPEVGFCHGQYFTMDGSGRLLRLKRLRGPKVTYIGDSRTETTELLMGERKTDYLFVRRSCFKQIGLHNTELRMSEDWDMLIRLSRRYAVGHIAEPMGIIRNHAQSMTAKFSAEIVKNAHTAVLGSIFNDAEYGPLYGHLRKKAYFGLHCLLARTAARTGHKGLGLLCLIQAIKTYPKFIFDAKAFSLLLRSTKEFLPQKLRRLIIEVLMALRLR
jgi:glycosyltransferase involved in cell wall biosynthesis